MRRKLCCLTAVWVILFLAFQPEAHAAGAPQDLRSGGIRATEEFAVTVSGKTLEFSQDVFSMSPGGIVEIKASYMPFDAEVEFGVVASDGRFYYVLGKNGSVDAAIVINKQGDYRLAIRNHATETIHVSGFVKH